MCSHVVMVELAQKHKSRQKRAGFPILVKGSHMAELSVKYGEMHFTPFVGGAVLIGRLAKGIDTGKGKALVEL